VFLLFCYFLAVGISGVFSFIFLEKVLLLFS